MDKVIFYFSGTGNSLRAARLIAGELGGARLLAMRKDLALDAAAGARVVGFVCPVYEWDVPQVVREFVSRLTLDPEVYTFMVATYVAIHGRCFETVDALLQEKGSRLHYGRALRCVASQCIAYEPFPPAKWMVPYSDRRVKRIGKELATGQENRYPRMSPLTKWLYPRLMGPIMNIQREYDKGFYTSKACIGCRVCARVCPCQNITFEEGRPVWNHGCEGCNACVAYCPTKAIQFRTPEAYVRLNTFITRRLGLPEKRTRYHNPYVTAADLMEVVENR